MGGKKGDSSGLLSSNKPIVFQCQLLIDTQCDLRTISVFLTTHMVHKCISKDIVIG